MLRRIRLSPKTRTGQSSSLPYPDVQPHAVLPFCTTESLADPDTTRIRTVGSCAKRYMSLLIHDPYISNM